MNRNRNEGVNWTGLVSVMRTEFPSVHSMEDPKVIGREAESEHVKEAWLGTLS